MTSRIQVPYSLNRHSLAVLRATGIREVRCAPIGPGPLAWPLPLGPPGR
jgi:hypothetical protein